MTDTLVTSRLGARAQTVVPKAVREALCIGSGDQISYTIHDRRVLLTAEKKPLLQEASFACFEEWASEADNQGCASR